MLTFLADENFDGTILRGLQRRRPDLDVARVQDMGLSGRDDPAVAIDVILLVSELIATEEMAGQVQCLPL